MATEIQPAIRPTGSPVARGGLREILVTVVYTLTAYLIVGLPLAALPPFVHGALGFSAVLAGLSVSVQYLATFLTRAPIGRMTDTVGPKQMVIFGLGACVCSGLFTVAGGLVAPGHPALSLTLLLIGRLCLGAGESGVSTGAITWAIGRTAPNQSARVISWNGIATYGGIAFGAPIGILIQSLIGFWGIGLVMALGGLIALPFAARGPVIRRASGVQMPMRSVLGRVLPHGVALALGSLGFGTIASFVTLFFAGRHWAGAALAVTAFGLFFILARLIFVNSIAREGGLRVACASFATEALGLIILGLAPSPLIAVAGAALTGFGFALVFPALGVEAFARVPATSRGAALGVFTVFLDVALGVTGPVAGFLSAAYGYASIFLLAGVAAIIGGGIAVALGARLARPKTA
ncbi:MAG TPA: MFS transporter [Acidisoma sp.]|uniref:MFS transporter n=1 Tax=Acidisoma sp. TaxID=1872115 RepID=UPI002C6A2DD1|nr:MFS transporter [Acidisoma sp.]HTI02085.1 MFS transporter [Acidisoma sp.]